MNLEPGKWIDAGYKFRPNYFFNYHENDTQRFFELTQANFDIMTQDNENLKVADISFKLDSEEVEHLEINPRKPIYQSEEIMYKEVEMLIGS